MSQEVIALRSIGRGPDDLRFFILCDGRHAGGVTVHSAKDGGFSYGIAVTPALRNRGVARRAIALLLAEMKRRGYHRAIVQIQPDNAPSLAAHAAAGFITVAQDAQTVVMARDL